MPKLNLVPIVPGQGRSRAPKGFPPQEAAIWRGIVASMPDHWFTPACQPVLRCLCSCIATADALVSKIAALRESNDVALRARAS
jgi:hypothetical protein